MSKQYSFNLLSEPWIPVVDHGGAARLISLREALVNAPAYRAISASLPHASAAVLRLLLAVLHRNFGPTDTPDWEEIWNAGCFNPVTLEAYFSRWQTRFDLFDETYPFFQQRHPLVEEKPAQVLLQAVGGGDTFTLFDHVMDATPFSLTPAEAALMLVTTQAFALAGLCHPQLKLVYTDAPCSRAVVFFVEGKNLFETLMFNLVRYNRAEPLPWDAQTGDRAFWEADDDPYKPDRAIPLGYLDYLTWPNRRLRLIPEERNGQVRVTRITTAPGLLLNAALHNPMHHYRIDPGKKAGEETYKVLRFSEGRALWRDSNALLDLRGQNREIPRAIRWVGELVNEGILPTEGRVQLSAYGMCTEPGKQKVFFYRREGFEIAPALLKDGMLIEKLDTALKHAKDLGDSLRFVIRELAAWIVALNANQETIQKNASKKDDDVSNLMAHWNAEGLYWNNLEVPFLSFLHRLPDDPQGAEDSWNEDLERAFRGAYNQTVENLGDDLKALKAAAYTRGRLNYSLKKVLGEKPVED